jgi:anti-sigma factor RsiW
MPLTDERKLKALVRSLGLKKLKRKPPPPQVPIKDDEADDTPWKGPVDGDDELSRDAREKYEAYIEAAKRLAAQRQAERAAERAKKQPPRWTSVHRPEPPAFLRHYFLDGAPRRVWLKGQSPSR